MRNTVQALHNHKKSQEFFIALDSDGCVFDSMEVKQKECFIPCTCQYFGLKAVAKHARMAGEFVNLYSEGRGLNRYPALLRIFDLLEDWDKVRERGVTIPKVPNLRAWVAQETKLGNPALDAYCETNDHEDMHLTKLWSDAVNVRVEEVVGDGLPPFPYVNEVITQASAKADMLVCSQTPTEALVREWEELALDQYIFTIAGQELGTKAEHIQFAARDQYEPRKMLMVGDARGDQRTAETTASLFFPILPGDEDLSWKRLHEEGLDRFFNGTFAGSYQDALVEEFDRYLPETPPWKKDIAS
jgi:phosphoglycolate phosphatase-like HAD superfamily hydrolase